MGTRGIRYKDIEDLQRGEKGQSFFIYTESLGDAKKANTSLGTQRKDELVHT